VTFEEHKNPNTKLKFLKQTLANLLSFFSLTMAVIETNIKSSLHIRSNSLPSTPHPLISQFENKLQRLKSSVCDSSASSSLVCNKLNGMQDLHDCIDKFRLERSLRILDICSTTKGCLSLSKENIQELQLVIRRKRGVETGFTVEGGEDIV